MKYAFVFAGQGAQYPGMGQEFYQQFTYVQNLYDKASKILGFDVPSLCFQESELLSQTKYTQPCMLVTSCAIYEVVKNELQITPIVAAGFSLGEYSALYASNIFDFQTIIKLIQYRATFMNEDAENYPGKMAAFIGIDLKYLESLCEEIGGVQIANFNSPQQLVISGKIDSVDQVIRFAEGKARKVIPLNVSGAFHTPLMQQASIKLYDEVIKMPYNNPHFDVIANFNALPYDINNLAQTMKKQVTSPVRWIDTINYIVNNYQIDGFIEIGPGKVLSGLIKKINPNVKVISINDMNDLQILREEINEFK